jgi:hypothetical protein
VLAHVLRWRTGLPYVITAHGSDVPGFNPNRFKTLHKVLAPAWRRIVREAAGIVAPSERLPGLPADTVSIVEAQTDSTDQGKSQSVMKFSSAMSCPESCNVNIAGDERTVGLES